MARVLVSESGRFQKNGHSFRFSHNIANKHFRRVVTQSSTGYCRLLQHSQHNRTGITTQELRRKRGMLQGLVVQDLCSHRELLVAHSIPVCPVNSSIGERYKIALAYENYRVVHKLHADCSAANAARQMSRTEGVAESHEGYTHTARLYRRQAVTENPWWLTPSRFV